jgi:hypothetical protein
MRCARAHESGERDGLGSRRQTHYSYTAFLSASSVLASLSRKVMNELRRSLGAKGTPAWRLSTALACLLGVVDGAAQHEDTYGRPATPSPAASSHACRSAHDACGSLDLEELGRTLIYFS